MARKAGADHVVRLRGTGGREASSWAPGERVCAQEEEAGGTRVAFTVARDGHDCSGRGHATLRAAYSAISVIGGRSSVSTGWVCGSKPCGPRSNWVRAGRRRWPRARRSWAVR